MACRATSSRTQSCPRSVDVHGASSGQVFEHRFGQTSEAGERRAGVVIAFFFGRPQHHLAIRARDQIALAGPDDLPRPTLARLEGDDLAFDWHDWHVEASFSDWIATSFGRALTVGALLAIAGLGVAGSVTRPTIRRLVSLGKQVAAHYGFPQDIEWAWANDRR